jgi:hypothetical protein
MLSLLDKSQTDKPHSSRRAPTACRFTYSSSLFIKIGRENSEEVEWKGRIVEQIECALNKGVECALNKGVECALNKGVECTLNKGVEV